MDQILTSVGWWGKHFYIVSYSFLSSVHIEVLQRVKTPNTKPKKISESGSEDRWVFVVLLSLNTSLLSERVCSPLEKYVFSLLTLKPQKLHCWWLLIRWWLYWEPLITSYVFLSVSVTAMCESLTLSPLCFCACFILSSSPVLMLPRAIGSNSSGFSRVLGH